MGDQGVGGSRERQLGELVGVVLHHAVENVRDRAGATDAQFCRDARMLLVMYSNRHHFSPVLLLNVLNEGTQAQSQQGRFCIKLVVMHSVRHHGISCGNDLLAVRRGNHGNKDGVETQGQHALHDLRIQHNRGRHIPLNRSLSSRTRLSCPS